MSLKNQLQNNIKQRKPRKILRVPEARTFVVISVIVFFLQILPTESEGKEGQRLERKAKIVFS